MAGIQISALADRQLSLDLSSSYTLFQKWDNSPSLGAGFGNGSRFDIRIGSSFPLGRICRASLTVADGIYNGTYGAYNDLRLGASLNSSWERGVRFRARAVSFAAQSSAAYSLKPEPNHPSI
ncbi:MAG: hypothetical protein ABIK43_05205 [candidate division WOR-3 bacterium]